MKKTLLFLFCWAISLFVQGQDPDLHVVSSAGRSFDSGNLSLDWTLGEVVVAYFDTPSGSLSQGFHQPVYQLVAIKSIPKENGMIVALPNPMDDELILNMSFSQSETGTIGLLDLQGNSIWKKSFEGHSLLEKYDVKHLPSGVYVLMVSLSDGAFVQSYQLVKTQ